MKKYLFIIQVVLVFLLSGVPDCIVEAENIVKIKRVAVMPFGTFTVGDISVDVTRLISDCLAKNEFKIISHDVLENFLVKRRIRGTEFLNGSDIREMGVILKTDVLILGSVDLFEDGENPQTAINARMIDCLDASVVWADSISHTGDDFATFLGLGRITSLKKLIEITVEELLSDLPSTVNSTSSSVNPIEIGHAGFFPDVLRGGETTRISIEVKEITGNLQDIKAFILDSEIDLKTEDGKQYTGTIQAPVADGTYSLKIYVYDQLNRLYVIDSAAGLTVHSSPPQVTLLFPQSLISPNNDGINDYIQFFPELVKTIRLETWRIEIVDEGDNIVRSEEGFGTLPTGFSWRGEDNQYKIVKDGTYFCRLFVEDKAGNKMVTAKDKITVDKTPPEIAVTATGESEESLTMALETKDISKIAEWKVIVYDKTGVEAGRFEGTENIPASIVCPLEKASKKSLNSTEECLFTYSLEARDVAGNRLQVEKQPLKRPEPEITEIGFEKKIDEWVEDF